VEREGFVFESLFTVHDLGIVPDAAASAAR
jgi:hypothetical protein